MPQIEVKGAAAEIADLLELQRLDAQGASVGVMIVTLTSMTRTHLSRSLTDSHARLTMLHRVY